MANNGFGGHPNIGTKWTSGNLVFFDRSSGTEIAEFDASTQTLKIGASGTLDVSAGSVTGTIGGKLGTAAAEADAASITIATATPSHRIDTDGANFSGAANVLADDTGVDGQLLFLEFVNAAANGNTVLTFTTNFKSSGTATIAQAKTANFIFKSNGTNWIEVSRLLTVTS